MTPWEVIEEALAQKRPPRGPAWLAEQLKERIQVVSNWKSRGKVPASRYREVAQILGLTVDQLEGLAPLPWEVKQEASTPTLLPEIVDLAWQMQSLDRHALETIVLPVLRSAITAARNATASPSSNTTEKESTQPSQVTSPNVRRATN